MRRAKNTIRVRFVKNRCGLVYCGWTVGSSVGVAWHDGGGRGEGRGAVDGQVAGGMGRASNIGPSPKMRSRLYQACLT